MKDSRGEGSREADISLSVELAPAVGVLSISLTYSFGERVRVTVFDVIGRPRLSYGFEGPRTMIDVSRLGRGVYFVTVRIGESLSHTSRIVIYR